MSDVIYHALIKKSENDEKNATKGNTFIVYPINSAEDVTIPKLANIPVGVKNLLDLIELINPNLLGDFDKKALELDQLTNDRQIKGIEKGTTMHHVVVWGKDGYTVEDSGFTIESSVPKDAKFTDTTYSNASVVDAGVVQLCDDVDSTSKSKAATANALRKAYELADSKVESITPGEENGAIHVDDEDVFVSGLGSAAFKKASEFATAEQGKKADSAIQAIRVGLVEECDPEESADVVPLTLKNITTLNFKLPKGVPGTKWYFGTAIFGKKKEPTVYIETKIVRARIGDVYLNTYNNQYYECTKEGNNEEAEWVYQGTLGGISEGGDSPGNSGDSAYDIWIGLGNVGSETDFINSLKGAPGENGITPHIGSNYNWYIGSVDTGVKAKGDPGENAPIPYIGVNGHWVIGDVDTGVPATGASGISPHIGENGHWFIGEEDTGVVGSGSNGITPHIGENGNWFIGDTDTGVCATADNAYSEELKETIKTQGETIDNLNKKIKDLEDIVNRLNETALTTDNFVEASSEQIRERLEAI